MTEENNNIDLGLSAGGQKTGGMDNYAIADQFSLLAKLMDIHGENAFKTKTYSSAAFTIEKLPEQLAGLPETKIL
ncbi:MAG TPA: helix-hairpin-helix domain-containing protein, partial [Flavisolibacter sp.]